jgi:hypothetical protein
VRLTKPLNKLLTQARKLRTAIPTEAQTTSKQQWLSFLLPFTSSFPIFIISLFAYFVRLFFIRFFLSSVFYFFLSFYLTISYLQTQSQFR